MTQETLVPGIKSRESSLIAAELNRRGIAFTCANGNALVFRNGTGRRLVYRAGMPSCNDRCAKVICTNKEATKAFLLDKGIPVARSAIFDAGDREEALRFAEFLGYPVVLKRLEGYGGRGVLPDLRSREELMLAWCSVDLESRFLVEKHVQGGDYRLLIVDRRLVAATRREPPSVVGDGVSTIEALLKQRHLERRRVRNPVHKCIKVTPDFISLLRRRGIALTDVLPHGERRYLTACANVSSGGDAFDITDEVPNRFADLAIAAADAIPGLRAAGVDLIIKDFSGDATARNCTVLEINHNPGMSMHYYPWGGRSRNAAAAMVDAMLA